ncbi:AbrB/MazE/SpoVT family DNA-binding domain-containing protein [Candidatus Uhrbacteria bacterium]|nr:AbrB/MazE/SpoVT family DNA-binding domain-containing protein [Candidatus Uhrbacteria bacterium]
MKSALITRPNDKGQIVIPKDMTEQLGIGNKIPLHLVVMGNSICIYPAWRALSAIERERAPSYMKILEKTRGAWGDDSGESLKKKKRTLELSASKKRRLAWS